MMILNVNIQMFVFPIVETVDNIYLKRNSVNIANMKYANMIVTIVLKKLMGVIAMIVKHSVKNVLDFVVNLIVRT